MQNTIEFQDLRQQIDAFAEKAHAGESFVVTEHAKPLFQIGPVEEEWESLGEYEHPDRIKNAYLNAIKRFPPLEV